MEFRYTRSYAALRAADLDWIVWPGYSSGGHILEKNQPGTMKNHEIWHGTMKNQPGTMENHENRPGTMNNPPGTMKNHENRPLPMKYQTETIKTK